MKRKTMILKGYGIVKLKDVAVYLISDIIKDKENNLSEYQIGYLQGRLDQAIKMQSPISVNGEKYD